MSSLCVLRRWCFCPVLCVLVIMVTAMRGGDSISVCLNTVAVLFLCEVDNLSYSLGLPESWKARIEQAGRIELQVSPLKLNLIYLAKLLSN